METSPECTEGYRAYWSQSVSLDDNPYNGIDSIKALDWYGGYLEGMDQDIN
jgi:hypothetical protein